MTKGATSKGTQIFNLVSIFQSSEVHVYIFHNALYTAIANCRIEQQKH